MSEIRHFLVQRRFGKLESVRVFDDVSEALRAFEQQERENVGVMYVGLTVIGEADCILLGADRLATLIATHSNWFDERCDLFGDISAALPPETGQDR